ncbi:hypothetical protein HHA01_05410 [Halomonas halmophila]|uniref:GGDEF-domain containing protein n=1 Tax=Halomonas halmophila TaxID=252 RepID=A0A4Y4F148_9GAMM|nr:hypothetical protein HHA01_05410 [Halomonas halmophila]
MHWIERTVHSRFVSGFVPDELKSTDSIDEYRARLLVIFAIGVVAIGWCASAFYLFMTAYLACLIAVVGGLAILCGPLLMKSRGNLGLGALVATTGLFGTVFAFSWLTGGIAAPSLLWMVTVPIFALVIHSTSAGIGWALLVILAVGGFYALEPRSLSAWVPHPFAIPELHLLKFVAVTSVAVVILQFALIYGWLHGRWNQKLVEARDALAYRACFDQLTGLPNREEFQQRFMTRIIAARRDGAPFWYGFLDLDNFKAVNDSLGHPGGDRIIDLVARRLHYALREGGSIGRIGGDEFGILIDIDPTGDDRQDLLARLTEAFSSPFDIDGANVRLAASIGLARSDIHDFSAHSDEDVLEILHRTANRAMFRAKQVPGPRIEYFDPLDRGESDRRVQRENAIREGLAQGQFEAYYQPIVEIPGGRLIGAEVLARWNHPEHGLLGPDEFLPLALQSPLIHDVADALAEALCRDLASTRMREPHAPPLALQVNLSPEQLYAMERLEPLIYRLTVNCQEAVEMRFEITESEWTKNEEGFEWLKSLGVDLIIDDFGKGYSSLSRLAHMPCRGLKLDREFIQDIDATPQNQALVRAVVQMGRALDLSVVAEGVETQAELDVIRRAGVDIVQGFYFARPMPFQALLDYRDGSRQAS